VPEAAHCAFRPVPPGADDAAIFRISGGDDARPDRLAALHDLYGRTILKQEITPLPGCALDMDIAFRRLPGLGLASASCSGLVAHRHAEHLGDDLVLNISLAGGRTIRACGREANVAEGEAILLSGAEIGVVTIPAPARYLSLCVPSKALAPKVANLNAHLVKTIPRQTGPLLLLAKYAAALSGPNAVGNAELQGLAATHVHELIALTLGTTRDAAEIAQERSVRAARLAAIKSDIVANLGEADLSLTALAARHRCTPRYVQRLFDDEGVTFTDYVLTQRLARAHRMLSNPLRSGEKIASVAYDVGFNDLSHFNRAFRKRYGETPSEVRSGARQSGA
jgi:AraC-like DNA-binding protein